MALFGFGKKDEGAAPQRQRVPVDYVIRMRRQGLSNNQIVQALQRNGYPTHQIFDAFSQADLRPPSPVQGMPQQFRQPDGLGAPPPLPFNEGSQGAEVLEQGMENETTITGPQSPEEMAGIAQEGTEEQFRQQETQQPFACQHFQQSASARVEEISEAIIEEKWQDLMKDYNKLVDWKCGVEQRMAALEQRFTDMKTAFDNLQKSVVDKVSDYDKSVKDVGSEMKALEQVFQKIIPTLTENVNELSRITKGMKAPVQPKKTT